MAKVGIVMGSDSDMPVMAKAAEILDKFGIDYEMTIISAHREPDLFFKWAKAAEEKGFKVIIAGAGKAAHLPGMCAAIFPLPVIGIPMKTSDLGGVDSLYSIVQMPSGIPVATVAINGGADVYKRQGRWCNQAAAESLCGHRNRKSTGIIRNADAAGISAGSFYDLCFYGVSGTSGCCGDIEGRISRSVIQSSAGIVGRRVVCASQHIGNDLCA